MNVASQQGLKRWHALVVWMLIWGCHEKEGQLSSSVSISGQSNEARILGYDKSDGGALAPEWILRIVDWGAWIDTYDEEITRIWVHAHVANLSWNKRLVVEVLSKYEDGQEIRTFAPMSFSEKRGHDDLWSTDAIETYPLRGPNDQRLIESVRFRVRLQMDTGSGESFWVTPWLVQDTGRLSYGPYADQRDWPLNLDSPVRSTLTQHHAEVFFAPFDDPGRAIIQRIMNLIERKRAQPEERITLHAAVFNINDPELISYLIEAHHAGVEVRLIMDGRKFRPRYSWYQGDDLLLKAGVPLVGIHREAGAMHNKFVIFNGEEVATGSMNWEPRARSDNHENVIFSSHRDVITAYARRFEVLAGGRARPREAAHRLEDEVSVTFAPDEPSHLAVAQLIDQAQESILVSMFTAKDIWWYEDGRRESLLTKLIDAHERGVKVIAIIDRDIHEASEYYGIESEDDPIDEWLEESGVRVVRADNERNRYASMHHKFVVIDDEIVVTGAYNWYYDSAYRNDEDQLVIRDENIAKLYRGEFVDLLYHYDRIRFQDDQWPQKLVAFEVYQDKTYFGDRLVISGDHERLGAWNPHEGLNLDGSSWPIWKGQFSLPAGVRSEFKLAIIGRDNQLYWESGDNRRLQTQGAEGEQSVTISWRE